jgi:ribosomal-protein-alanine N-acetyltransferase
MVQDRIKAVPALRLTTQRLILRPFEMEDALFLFGWASDPEVTRFLRFPMHASLADSKRIITRWIDEGRRPPSFQWAVTLKENGIPIGSISLEIINSHDCRGEVGYCLSKEYWNQGFMTEALKAVLGFGFNVAAFHRIEACYSVDNPASGKVMLKAGMVREAGPLHDYYRADRLGYQDVMMMVALSDTYVGD